MGSHHCLGKLSLPLLWSLRSHTLLPAPRVPEILILSNLIHKPSLISQPGCPLGGFWGCYGSKIDISHLKRQFSVAQEDRQHPAWLYPTGAGVTTIPTSAVCFRSPCSCVLLAGPSSEEKAVAQQWEGSERHATFLLCRRCFAAPYISLSGCDHGCCLSDTQ